MTSESEIDNNFFVLRMTEGYSLKVYMDMMYHFIKRLKFNVVKDRVYIFQQNQEDTSSIDEDKKSEAAKTFEPTIMFHVEYGNTNVEKLVWQKDFSFTLMTKIFKDILSNTKKKDSVTLFIPMFEKGSKPQRLFVEIEDGSGRGGPQREREAKFIAIDYSESIEKVDVPPLSNFFQPISVTSGKFSKMKKFYSAAAVDHVVVQAQLDNYVCFSTSIGTTYGNDLKIGHLKTGERTTLAKKYGLENQVIIDADILREEHERQQKIPFFPFVYEGYYEKMIFSYITKIGSLAQSFYFYHPVPTVDKKENALVKGSSIKLRVNNKDSSWLDIYIREKPQFPGTK